MSVDSMKELRRRIEELPAGYILRIEVIELLDSFKSSVRARNLSEDDIRVLMTLPVVKLTEENVKKYQAVLRKILELRRLLEGEGEGVRE